jgi:choline-sulfatase
MIRDNQLIEEPGYITDRITDEALGLIDRYAAAGLPFYLSVHYNAPHFPWDGHPQEIVDSYDDCPFMSCPQEPKHPGVRPLTDQCLGNREMLKGFFAAVTAMERTLVVFLSDNGFACGHHGFWGKGNGTTSRNMNEVSIKVPAIVSHPAHLPAGRVEQALVSAYDVMPTLLDYVSLPIPTDRHLPGRSLVSLLRGEPGREREHVVVFDEYGPVRMIRTREWKYVYRHAYEPHELYNVPDDPDDRHDLSGEPAYAGKIRELQGEMEQ